MAAKKLITFFVYDWPKIDIKDRTFCQNLGFHARGTHRNAKIMDYITNKMYDSNIPENA